MSDRCFGVVVQPLFDFRVPVGKGKTTGPVVCGGGHIRPLRARVGLHAHGEEAVVEAVRTFVQQHPQIHCADFAGIAGFQKALPAGNRSIDVVGDVRDIADKAIHGITADARSPGGGEKVGRTFECAGVLRHIGADFTGSHQSGVGVLKVGCGGIVPGHLTMHPCGRADGSAGIFRKLVLVVTGVDHDGQLQLFKIVHAVDPLRLHFGLAQGGQ